VSWLFGFAVGGWLLATPVDAVETSSTSLSQQFTNTIRPLVQQYCLGCHSTEKHKGDLDLERFTSFDELLKHPKVWQTVVEQLSLGEMPPKTKPQPTAEQRGQLLDWVNSALDAAAQTRAGDPGPVVLRRLDNAEYTYTVRDLSSVPTLDPVKEFPADSAAGEGFMNTGNSLVMSPALLSKYLDAGKDVASHAVLLPDGFRFSAKTSRRDWTEEILSQIRAIYREFTDAHGAEKVNLQGIVFETNEGGRLPLPRYLRACLELRDEAGTSPPGDDAIQVLAAREHLSGKYLRTLWAVLNSTETSLLLDPIRAHWRAAQTQDAPALASEIGQWQQALWKFSSVGHIGKLGGPKAWMEPVSPLVNHQDFHLKLARPTNGNDLTVFLVASDAGDGNAHDFVVWKEPHLFVPGRLYVPLRDARSLINEVAARRQRIFKATAACLKLASEASDTTNHIDSADLAKQHEVDADALQAWFGYLGVGRDATLHLDHLTNQIQQSGGYSFIQGWGSADTPLLLANASEMPVRIPGNMKPHGVALHPSPKLNVAAGWSSPLADSFRVEAKITHAHPECGNGIEWFLELRRGKTHQRLAHGFAQGSKPVMVGPVEYLAVQSGDLVSIVIGPRDGNHACDLTDVEFVLTSETTGRQWSLTRDISDNVLAANPHPDHDGTPGIWHFYSEPVSGQSGRDIPTGSLLAQWQSASDPERKEKLAQDLQHLLLAGPPAVKDSPDAQLYQQLASLEGPMVASDPALSKAQADRPIAPDALPTGRWALDPELFGKHPNGSTVDAASLCVQAPSVLEIHLPADLVAGAELVTTAVLDQPTGAEGSVQVQVTTTPPAQQSGLVASSPRVSDRNGAWTSNNREVSHSSPILVNEGSAARQRIEASFDEFRRWFPAALCYEKIVPVDEVITLILFHREDEPLCRLMLDDAQKAKLDRLWEELRYVSRDALTLVDAFEQLWQYATQDADPKVFEPLRKPINDRAAAFRQRLLDTQPKHLDALLEFARRAYRRPLADAETQELRSLYYKLRSQGMTHEEAFQLTLARVFVAPAFLYRLEDAPPGTKPGPITDWEIATRLSYFLWSSAPDEQLSALALKGQLHQPEVLNAQADRMLRDQRLRRLATEFACTWLHIHDFDELNEKSERHFPTFNTMRGPMYEEAIQYFTDLFQHDGSLLDIFDSDHTFLNQTLAEHYGIAGVTGDEWRRVDGVRKFGRGGVLGLGATLAKESGASRTSPILRGNWVAEVLLGDKLPRPPKDVPRLPEDEATETLTVRQLVERHSSDPRCAGCHQRIDGYGFALEAYDAIGRARTTDLGHRLIETRSKLFDGTEVAGAQELRQYLLTRKRDVVLRQFCRKLVGYALGRGVLLSDKSLLDEMVTQLREHDDRFSAAVHTLVQSPQFLQIRGREMGAED
jgi:hypothetical protein